MSGVLKVLKNMTTPKNTKKKALIWHTEKRKVSDLIPNEKNPRTMSQKQIEDLKKSLKKFNLVELPAIDTNNKVIVGHQRLMVLALLGRSEEEIEVRVPNRKLTRKEYDQYLLTSNRVHGDWDWEKLAASFDTDMLLASGFDDIDLSHLFDDFAVEDDEFDEEKELAKIKVPKSKDGDIYELGGHRLICGDSTDPDVVQRLFEKEKADIIYSDPPYNISLDYDKGLGGKQHYGGNVNDSKSNLEYELFLRRTLENGLSVTKPHAHVFYWCDQTYIGMVQKLYKELGINNKRVCLWIKGSANPTPGVAFNKCYEPCVYGTRRKPYLSDKVLNLTEVMNKEVGSGNRALEDIYDMLNIWLVKRITGSQYEHPTQKPPTLHEKALRRCTRLNDVVLDLFGGSGSTLIACEQLKRRAFVVEKEPVFIDLTIRRYEMFTGKKAKKIKS